MIFQKCEMQFNSSRKFILTFLVGLLFFAVSCKKEEEKAPSIILKNDIGYTATNKTVLIGMPVKIGIKAEKEDANITNLVVSLITENGTELALDTGLNSSVLNYTRNINYGSTKYEIWTFTVMDKNRKKSSLSIRLDKDTNSTYGAILSYPSITLGMQNNTAIGNFLATTTGSVYTESAAFDNQSLINIIAYYNNLAVPSTEFTFSSPNETDAPTYYTSLVNWALPKNEIYYKADSISISTAAFDAAYNDSLIISNYTEATTGKRKFKIAKPNYVIPFKITAGPQAGKKGLIKVKSINGTTDGSIEIALKIQQ